MATTLAEVMMIRCDALEKLKIQMFNSSCQGILSQLLDLVYDFMIEKITFVQRLAERSNYLLLI